MPNIGRKPLNPSSPVGQVRLLLGDTDPVDAADGDGEYLFYSDNEIESLLNMHGGSPKRTVVRILRSVGFAQVYLLKKFTSADVAVDGTAVARELRLLAIDLEREADEEDARGDGGSVFLTSPTGGFGTTAMDAYGEIHRGEYLIPGIL